MDKIKEINEFISKELWFDFEVKSFDGYTLIIIGGIDLYYNWLIELKFTDVSFLSLKNDWKRSDKLDLLEIITGEKEKVIKKLQFIDRDYIIFGLNHEDLNSENSNQYIIAATEIEYLINR